MKPATICYKCTVRKRTKMRQEKQKKMGGEQAKKKSRCGVTFKPKNYPKILLSVHAWTLQAN